MIQCRWSLEERARHTAQPIGFDRKKGGLSQLVSVPAAAAAAAVRDDRDKRPRHQEAVKATALERLVDFFE
jgi:hypothetical protein